MSLITDAEDSIRELWQRVSGEAEHAAEAGEKVAEEVRDEALAALAGLKAEAAKLGPLVTVAELDLKAIADQAGPGLVALVTAVKDLLGKL